MMLFWLLAVSLTLVALALALFPLLRSAEGFTDERRMQNILIARQRKAELKAERQAGNLDETAYQQALAEVADSLGQDIQAEGVALPVQDARAPKILIALVGLSIPLLAFGLYGMLGAPAAIPESSVQPDAMPASHADAHMGEGAMPDMGKMLGSLEERLRASPHDIDGWLMLGRSYVVLGRYDEAISAYEKGAGLNPDVPALLFAWADTLAANQGGNFGGKSLGLLQQGLTLDPQNPMGLWLAASAAMQAGNTALAIQHWNTLLPLLPDASPDQQEVRTLILQAGGTPLR